MANYQLDSSRTGHGEDLDKKPDISELTAEKLCVLKPDTWNNIPVCLVKSITVLIETLGLLATTMQSDRLSLA
jgi:hypothetical protein